jgi:hypothetical protein
MERKQSSRLDLMAKDGRVNGCKGTEYRVGKLGKRGVGGVHVYNGGN